MKEEKEVGGIMYQLGKGICALDERLGVKCEGAEG